MPKKCKTPKNGECGENQALRLTIWYVLRNKEEIFVLCCPSPQSPMLAEENQEIAAGTDGKGWPAAARCCKSGQGRMNAVLTCGRRAGTGFRDVLDFLLLRRLSKALCCGRIQKLEESPLPACLSGGYLSQQSPAVPLAHPPGQILPTGKTSRTRTQMWFSITAVPVPSWWGSVWAVLVALSRMGHLENSVQAGFVVGKVGLGRKRFTAFIERPKKGPQMLLFRVFFPFCSFRVWCSWLRQRRLRKH